MVDQHQLAIYKASLQKAWEDGVITPHEHEVIENLRRMMNISGELQAKLDSEVIGKLNERPGLDVYKAALEQAMVDKIITPDEYALLEKLKNVLHITAEEQNRIENELRLKLGTTGQQNSSYEIQPRPQPPLNPNPYPIQNYSNNLGNQAGTPAPSPIPSPSPSPPVANVPEGDAAFWLNQGELVFTNSNGDQLKIETAINYFDKAIQIEPLNHTAWSNKGLGLKILNRYEDALLCYERAIMLCPEHINTWFNKAVLLGCMNKYEDAVVCYQKVLELDPAHDLARRDLNIINEFLKTQRNSQ